MADSAYELLALAMRYVFVLAGALLLWRAFRWMRRDARQYQRDMRALPDAGLVGEVVDLRTGQAQPLPREGTIGSSRECDIRVKDTGVKRNHALFTFEDGKGLRIVPRLGARVLLNGREIGGSGYALHGTRLQLGGAELRVRLFAGLNVPFYPAWQQEAPDVTLENFSFVEEAAPAPLPFPAPGFDAAETAEDGADGFPQPGAYDGGYTDDGQMTWQYAYSLEDLRKAQEEAAQMQSESLKADLEEGEALPYESPVPRRRRRSERHG